MAKKKVPVIIEGVMHFTCSKCQQLKPIELMKKDPNSPYGIRSSCKTCNSLATIKSVTKNLEHYIIYRKQYYKDNEERILNNVKQSIKNNPKHYADYHANYNAERRANDPIFKFKDNIRDLTNKAILRGKLTKSNTCSHCYSTQDIEAHHPEYSLEKALEVIWLCNKCHDALHKSLFEQPKVIFPVNFVIEE